MPSCAFLTLADPTGYVIDDGLAIEPLAALGWMVSTVPWRQTDVPWSSFDAVVVRSTWDYHHDRDAFTAVLESVVAAGAPLFNSIETIRWNLHKTYLLELAARGVPTVPTVVRSGLAAEELPRLFDIHGDSELVLKPAVGANATGVLHLNHRSWMARQARIVAYFCEREYLVQPFARAVREQGEFSLFYFNGEFSHAVQKMPAAGDFRVQEEHGGRITAAVPNADLLAAGRAAIAALGEVPLYARADLVRSNDDSGYWLMELELIEPSLYLRMDSRAAGRFASAFVSRMAGLVARPSQ